MFDDLPQMLKLLLWADQNTLANVNQCRYELQLSKKHQVALVLDLEQLYDFLQILIKCIIISNRWIHLLLEL